MIVTQGADVAGGAGCFHGVTTDKAGVRTTVYTTTGHFRVNGLEVDTLAASEAKLEWKRKTSGAKETISLKLTAPKVKVEGTAKKTDFMFHEGSINWDLSGTTIAGFVVDPNAGVGGLALKVLGPPTLNADGSSTLDVLPGHAARAARQDAERAGPPRVRPVGQRGRARRVQLPRRPDPARRDPARPGHGHLRRRRQLADRGRGRRSRTRSRPRSRAAW